MIHVQQMALAGAFVEHCTRDTVGLAPAVGGGNVAIEVALPDVHGHGDVFEPEPPVGGEEPLILRPGPAGRRRGVPEVSEKGIPDRWPPQHGGVWGR